MENYETRVWGAPSAKASGQLLPQILLALEHDVAHVHTLRQKPRKQTFKHVPGGLFLQEKCQRRHSGSAPSKNPCFHNQPILSPSAM